jgi:hypothetical protein
MSRCNDNSKSRFLWGCGPSQAHHIYGADGRSQLTGFVGEMVVLTEIWVLKKLSGLFN